VALVAIASVTYELKQITMTFYSPSDSKFTRHYREEVEMVFSGIDCVLNGEQAIYCSSELTTGVRLYEALREHHLTTASELKKKMGREWFESNIFGVNMRCAMDFAKSVRASLGDQTMVITPAPFAARDWSQTEYLHFWETLIRTRIKSVWFNQSWEFSNGCAFELAVARHAGVPTMDCYGNVLSSEEAIRCLETAVAQLSAEKFDTTKLRETLARLHAAHTQDATASDSVSEKANTYLRT
jgi:hypothetical protein